MTPSRTTVSTAALLLVVLMCGASLAAAGQECIQGGNICTLQEGVAATARTFDGFVGGAYIPFRLNVQYPSGVEKAPVTVKISDLKILQQGMTGELQVYGSPGQVYKDFSDAESSTKTDVSGSIPGEALTLTIDGCDSKEGMWQVNVEVTKTFLFTFSIGSNFTIEYNVSRESGHCYTALYAILGVVAGLIAIGLLVFVIVKFSKSSGNKSGGAVAGRSAPSAAAPQAAARQCKCPFCASMNGVPMGLSAGASMKCAICNRVFAVPPPKAAERAQCPNCQTVVAIPPNVSAGGQVACNNCQQVFAAPQALPQAVVQQPQQPVVAAAVVYNPAAGAGAVRAAMPAPAALPDNKN